MEDTPDANKPEQCFWCGKDQLSGLWSGKQRKYCSFRCVAAGEYRNAAFILILSIPFTFLCLFFPGILYSYFDADYVIGGNPSLLALIGAGSTTLILLSMSSFTLYASYVGWSVRRNLDEISEYAQTDQRPLKLCVICGNPEVSTFWSSSRGFFCSFRCSAARDYMRFLGMAMTVLTLLCILSILTLRQPVIPIIIALPIVFVVMIDLGFFYAAYMGWKLHQELLLKTQSM